MRINLAFLSKLFLLVLFSSFLAYLWYYGNEGGRVGDVPKVQTYAKHFSGEARGLSIVSSTFCVSKAKSFEVYLSCV